jgi:predicted Fe-S protein YdhL (DUF1289 family)
VSEEIASPCINVCIIDECTGFCAGCMRTIDEITDWRNLTNAAKREVLVKVETRHQLVRQTKLTHQDHP